MHKNRHESINGNGSIGNSMSYSTSCTGLSTRTPNQKSRKSGYISNRIIDINERFSYTISTIISLILVTLLIFVVVSCTPQETSLRQKYGQSMMNLSDAQIQAMLTARIQACEGKSAGTSCVIESTRGNRSGICILEKNNLLCAAAVKST